MDIPEPSEVTEKAGLGISALLDGRIILAGNRALLMDESVMSSNSLDKKSPASADERVMSSNGLDATMPANADERGGTAVYISVDGVYAGVIELEDTLKPDSVEAIEKLHANGVSRTVMLTGDRPEAAESVRQAIGLTEARANLMPWQKVEAMEEIMSERTGSVIFMGDGINDAPVLARADVGIAMGALGADAAIEAADIVIMDDKPSKLVTAISIARKTRSIVRENVVLALGIKGAVLVFAALGFVNMWVAVFADVGVALLAVANALRTGSATKS
jgi:Cd2+/Zn2+-exporting ATPase